MAAKPRYRVTEQAIAAIERGKNRKGWTDADLARAIHSTRQAVGQILDGTTQRSELVPDMLQAVGEPQYLAFDLSSRDVEFLGLSKALEALPADVQTELMREIKRRIEGERARLELEAQKTSTDH